MNYILKCVNKYEHYEGYVIPNNVVAFDFEIDGSEEKDPIVNRVTFRGVDGCWYFCDELEITFNGNTIAYMSFDEREIWRRSEVLKVLMGVF